MSKIEIFFFSLCLFPSKIRDLCVPSSLIRRMRKTSPGVYRNLDIWGTSEEKNPHRQKLMARLLEI